MIFNLIIPLNIANFYRYSHISSLKISGKTKCNLNDHIYSTIFLCHTLILLIKGHPPFLLNLNSQQSTTIQSLQIQAVPTSYIPFCPNFYHKLPCSLYKNKSDSRNLEALLFMWLNRATLLLSNSASLLGGFPEAHNGSVSWGPLKWLCNSSSSKVCHNFFCLDNFF